MKKPGAYLAGAGQAPGGHPGANTGHSKAPSIARCADHFQRAHDLLVMLILDADLRERIGVDGSPALTAAADVLCWALGHDHNRTFADNLAKLERLLNAAGYVVCDLDGTQL